MKLGLLIFCIVWQLTKTAKTSNYSIGFPPLSSRIVGGTNAAEGQALYQCSLQNNGRHFCGCAIISSEWILTAAHCVNSNPENIEILMGTNDLKSKGTRYKLKYALVHEKYDKPLFAYDIGLIRVDGSIAFNDKIQPIKVSSKIVKENLPLQVTGWGRLSASGVIPQHLQVLNLTSISNESCKKIHGETVHDSHLCTYTTVGEGVCSGDSGGPLVLDHELVGLANWAVLCAVGYPDGFARISYLYDWIKLKIASN